MKIQGNKPPEGQEISLNAQKISKTDGNEKASAPEKPRTLSDKVDISGKGKEIAELMAAVNQLPDVRSDKVEAVKKAIESGTYKIDPRKIAEKFLEEI
ncbi:MAG TPA: flagellar biosynthesis anti-sigma factor FlgM [Thermodesulfovibrionales bacterium]|nr:flagellar biosynthesis anti-sigma factor FlgM [Thermodesulfovibrionales bacterium]